MIPNYGAEGFHFMYCATKPGPINEAACGLGMSTLCAAKLICRRR